MIRSKCMHENCLIDTEYAHITTRLTSTDTMSTGDKPWADGPFPLIKPEACGPEVQVRLGRLEERLRPTILTTSPSQNTDPNKPPQGLDCSIWEMAAVHNVFIRGLNAIHLQAINVGTKGTEQDIRDFVEFAAVWAQGIHEHHDLEETYVFPTIEKLTGVQGIMDANVQQHVAFHDGLSQYEGYLKRVLEGEEKYDGEKFRGIIDSFGETLGQHLNDEIPTLAGLRKFDKVDWIAFQKGIEEKIMEVVHAPGVKVSIPVMIP
jgi:hemerythrin HHE cation binding domain-containing protein